MAAPTVTLAASSRVGEYPPTSPRKIISATVVCDGTVGGAANDILASLFGMTFIEVASPLIKSDNTLIVDASPAYDGKSLLGKAAGTAAPANIPSGTYNVVLE